MARFGQDDFSGFGHSVLPSQDEWDGRPIMHGFQSRPDGSN
jgi:hypothetical protein